METFLTKQKTTKKRKAQRTFTKKETKQIYDLFYTQKSSIEDKKALADKLGRTYRDIYQKALYEHNKRKRPAKPDVVVTQVVHPNSTKEKATITVGNAKIEIPTNTITINGVEIAW